MLEKICLKILYCNQNLVSKRNFTKKLTIKDAKFEKIISCHSVFSKSLQTLLRESLIMLKKKLLDKL